MFVTCSEHNQQVIYITHWCSFKLMKINTCKMLYNPQQKVNTVYVSNAYPLRNPNLILNTRRRTVELIKQILHTFKMSEFIKYCNKTTPTAVIHMLPSFDLIYPVSYTQKSIFRTIQRVCMLYVGMV